MPPDPEGRTASAPGASHWRTLLRALAELADADDLQARAFTTLWDAYRDATSDGTLDAEELARLLAMLEELVATGGRSTGFDDTSSGGSQHHDWDWD